MNTYFSKCVITIYDEEGWEIEWEYRNSEWLNKIHILSSLFLNGIDSVVKLQLFPFPVTFTSPFNLYISSLSQFLLSLFTFSFIVYACHINYHQHYTVITAMNNIHSSHSQGIPSLSQLFKSQSGYSIESFLRQLNFRVKLDCVISSLSSFLSLTNQVNVKWQV